jgi:hypothetical protein
VISTGRCSHMTQCGWLCVATAAKLESLIKALQEIFVLFLY